MQYLKVMFKDPRSGVVIVIEELLIRPLMKLAMMLDGSKYLRMSVYNDEYARERKARYGVKQKIAS